MKEKSLSTLKSKNKSESGSSLIEVLIAIGIFSAVLLFSVQSFWKSEIVIKETDVVVRRVQLFHSLINIFGMPNSLRATLAQEATGTHLYRCKNGNVCSPVGRRGVKLYLPHLFFNGTTINLSGAISGPPTSPIVYSLDSRTCDPAAATCDPNEFPISVTTEYQAICPPRYDENSVGAMWPGGPIYPTGFVVNTINTCIRAHYVKIFFRFFPTPGATVAGASFQEVQGSVMVDLVQVGYSR